MEVESSQIDSFFNKTGRFTFKVVHDGRVITEQWMKINALTGDAGEGTMSTIANTHSIHHQNPDLFVSYGFYEAGQGHGILPDRHQCYITVTPDFSNWIGQVAPIGSPQKDKPFRKLVLPAAHDVGMNTMDNCAAVLKHAGGAVVRTLIAEEPHYEKVLAQITDAVSGAAVAALAPHIVSSLAITQKDPVQTILALGARYFEFRPAFMHKELRKYLPDKLYFQHSAIPGMGYDEFLGETVKFLLEFVFPLLNVTTVESSQLIRSMIATQLRSWLCSCAGMECQETARGQVSSNKTNISKPPFKKAPTIHIA